MRPTENQEKALDIGRSVCVTAGAGAGKTWVLVERYLKLLESGTKVNQILALTFTDKAAAEMRERVRKALAEKKGDEWRERLEEFNWCSISTFHSFCTNLIRQHPLETGMPPGFNVMDDVGSGVMKEEVYQSLMLEEREEMRENLVRALTLFGNNKLKDRLEYMYDRRTTIAPWIEDHKTKDSLMEWSVKLATEIQERMVTRVRGDPGLQQALSSISRLAASHSGDGDTGQKYLAQTGPIVDEILADHSNERTVKCLLDLYAVRGRRDMGSKKFFSAVEKEELLSSYEQILTCSGTLSPELLLGTDKDVIHRSVESLWDLLVIYRAYLMSIERTKQRQNAIDYEDMIGIVNDLVKKDQAIVETLRHRYRYLLVDEFQDTDPVQSFIVWAVAGNEPGDRLFIVGDAKQSIYGFRNADVAMFQRARNKLVKNDREAAVHLNINFRSSPQVVSFVNHVFSHLMQDEQMEYQFRYEEMDLSPERKNDRGSVEILLPTKVSKESKDTSQMSEMDMVASRIERMLAGDGTLVFVERDGKRLAEGRKPEPGDIAILLRVRTHLKKFEHALRERDIPYHVHKGIGFFERQEVLDVYNLLRFIADQSDDVSLYGVLRSPYFAFSDEELYSICRSPGFDLWTKLKKAMESDNDKARQAVAMLRSWCGFSGRVPISELVRKVQTDAGIYAVCAAQPDGDQMISNLEKLNEMLRGSKTECICTPHQAVDWMDKALRLAKQEGEAPVDVAAMSSVNIMTVHASKGLEFPVVFVPELGETPKNRNPSVLFNDEIGLGITVLDDDCNRIKDLAYSLIKVEADARSSEESKRLLYVAMTRAMDHLVLSGAIGSDDRTVMNWMDHLLSTIPSNTIPEGVSSVQMAPDVDLAIIRPDDLGPGSSERRSLSKYAPSTSMSSLPVWKPLLKPSRKLSMTATGLKAFESYPERFIRRNVFGVPEGWLEQDGTNDATTFGTAVHEVLRGRDASVVVQNLGISTAQAVEIERIRSDFEKAISTVSDGTEYRELRFQMNIDGHRFHGAIDRLDRIKEGGWLVMDFKTDADATINSRGTVEEHGEQVRAYMLALKNALRMDVKGSLFYTGKGKAIDVPMELGFEGRLREKMHQYVESVKMPVQRGCIKRT